MLQKKTKVHESEILLKPAPIFMVSGSIRLHWVHYYYTVSVQRAEFGERL